MSRYKVGDKVRVKCIQAETKSNCSGLTFTFNMTQYYDRVATITAKSLAGNDVRYKLDIDAKGNSYVAEWLESTCSEKIQLTTTELVERLLNGEKLVPSGMSFSDIVYCYYDANASGQPFIQQLQGAHGVCGMFSVWANTYWTVYKEATEMTITEIEQALGVSNLKVVK